MTAGSVVEQCPPGEFGLKLTGADVAEGACAAGGFVGSHVATGYEYVLDRDVEEGRGFSDRCPGRATDAEPPRHGRGRYPEFSGCVGVVAVRARIELLSHPPRKIVVLHGFLRNPFRIWRRRSAKDPVTQSPVAGRSAGLGLGCLGGGCGGKVGVRSS